jgi:hypothetical protein
MQEEIRQRDCSVDHERVREKSSVVNEGGLNWTGGSVGFLLHLSVVEVAYSTHCLLAELLKVTRKKVAVNDSELVQARVTVFFVS